MFKIRRQSGPALSKIVFSVQPLDLPAEIALRMQFVPSSPLCGWVMGVHGPEVSLAAASSATPGLLRFGRGTKSSDFAVSLLPLKDTVPGFESLIELSAGPAGYHLHMSTPEGVATYDAASKAFQVRTGMAELLAAVDDGVLARTSLTTVSIVRGAKADTVVSAAPGRELNWFEFDRRNELLVWTEGVPTSEGGYDPVALWYSPLSKGVALAPKKVGEYSETGLKFGNPFRAHGGSVLLRTSPYDGRVVRLADGQTWRFSTEPGTKFDALWVDDDEVVLLTTVDLKTEYPSSILRLRRDSLGVPGSF